MNSATLVCEPSYSEKALDSASSITEGASDNHAYALVRSGSSEIETTGSIIIAYHHDGKVISILLIHRGKDFSSCVVGDRDYT